MACTTPVPCGSGKRSVVRATIKNSAISWCDRRADSALTSGGVTALLRSSNGPVRRNLTELRFPMLKRAVGITALLSALVLAAPAMLESTASAAALPAMQGPVITGGWVSHNGSTAQVNAVMQGNGRVGGKVMVGFLGQPRVFEGNIDSVFVIGNVAYASGIIEALAPWPELVGTSFIFRVIDGGATDSHTPFFFWGDLLPDLCHDPDARGELEDTVAALNLERYVVQGDLRVH
jgi:hypothetical protein